MSYPDLTFINSAVRTSNLKLYGAEDSLILQYVILKKYVLFVVLRVGALSFVMNFIKLVMFQKLCILSCSHSMYFLN